MQNTSNSTAVILVDFINEIVAPNGKLAAKGYASFAEKHGVLEKVKAFLKEARTRGMLVIHVRVGFSQSYPEHPAASPLFGGAKKFGALQLGTWATEFHPEVSPVPGEIVLTKHRVSAFFSTSLDLILRSQRIHEVVVCGVATDLAVQATARDAHDRDYVVTIASDCCIAANEQDHEAALLGAAKIGSIKRAGDIW